MKEWNGRFGVSGAVQMAFYVPECMKVRDEPTGCAKVP